MFLFSLSSSAQYNIKKLLEEGKQQLDQGYYVTSMQIGMRIVSLKPQLYEAWYMMAKAKKREKEINNIDTSCYIKFKK